MKKLHSEGRDKVIRSAMRRIDYLALERSIIDVLGTVRGCHLAELVEAVRFRLEHEKVLMDVRDMES